MYFNAEYQTKESEGSLGESPVVNARSPLSSLSSAAKGSEYSTQ